MPQNTHLEVVKEEAERHFDSSTEIVQDLEAIRKHALETAPNLPWLPNTPSSSAVRGAVSGRRCQNATPDSGPEPSPERQRGFR